MAVVKKTVLFLCTGNSCRSIMAEALLRHLADDRFRALSAGSKPAGYVHPESLATLVKHSIGAEGFQSKSWDVFRDEQPDVVITVCDRAAGEACPYFSGDVIKAHWGVPDPAAFSGNKKDVDLKFERVFLLLKKRVEALTSLPIDLSGQELKEKLDQIGEL